jgi:hypothetical protein
MRIPPPSDSDGDRGNYEKQEEKPIPILEAAFLSNR